jgi:ornithine cyclodeaminase/alanine dehydrogenase-like protein (mu-crystallin family)
VKVLIADQAPVAEPLQMHEAVGEIGEVFTGAVPACTAPDQVTLFQSLGIAIEDLAAAHYAHAKAQERGLGTWVEIGGRHFGNAALAEA